VDGLIDTPVHRQVRLLVAFEVEGRHSQPAVNWCLVDRSEHCPAVPVDISRKPDAKRHNFHAKVLSYLPVTYLPRNSRINLAMVSPSVSRAKCPASKRWYSRVFRSRLYGSAPAAGKI
jgi:hypothetical protein